MSNMGNMGTEENASSEGRAKSSGNFANNRERAREAGRKGGESRGNRAA